MLHHLIGEFHQKPKVNEVGSSYPDYQKIWSDFSKTKTLGSKKADDHSSQIEGQILVTAR